MIKSNMTAEYARVLWRLDSLGTVTKDAYTGTPEDVSRFTKLSLEEFTGTAEDIAQHSQDPERNFRPGKEEIRAENLRGADRWGQQFAGIRERSGRIHIDNKPLVR